MIYHKYKYYVAAYCIADVFSDFPMAREKIVDLGFIGDFQSWELTSRQFPSKVGGKPAWLELKNLPSSETMKVGDWNIKFYLLEGKRERGWERKQETGWAPGNGKGKGTRNLKSKV